MAKRVQEETWDFKDHKEKWEPRVQLVLEEKRGCKERSEELETQELRAT